MKYPFPKMRDQCPLCGRPECATYRGYYTRFLFCPEMEVAGRIVIRTGSCRSEGRRFALLPDFVLRRCRLSRFGLERLREHRARLSRLRDAIDEWMDGLVDDFYLPSSTAYGYLTRKFSVPP